MKKNYKQDLKNVQLPLKIFEFSVINLLDGKAIKPSEIAKLRETLKYKLKVLDETIKLYCK